MSTRHTGCYAQVSMIRRQPQPIEEAASAGMTAQPVNLEIAHTALITRKRGFTAGGGAVRRGATLPSRRPASLSIERRGDRLDMRPWTRQCIRCAGR